MLNFSTTFLSEENPPKTQRTEYWINHAYWNTSASIISLSLLLLLCEWNKKSPSVALAHLGSNWNVKYFIGSKTAKALCHLQSHQKHTGLSLDSASPWSGVKRMKGGGCGALDIGNGILGSLGFEDWPAVIIFTKRLDWLFEEINMWYRLHAVVSLGGNGIFATLG